MEIQYIWLEHIFLNVYTYSQAHKFFTNVKQYI